MRITFARHGVSEANVGRVIANRGLAPAAAAHLRSDGLDYGGTVDVDA